jgi:putative oxidoreductase
VNVGLLLLHVFIGAALVAHGLQKLFVFGLGGTSAYLDSLGFRTPRLMAAAVIAAELLGGTLLGLGLVLPVGAVLVAATMLVAARTDHRAKGWFITGQGTEFVATNAVIALTLAAAGGGRYSLDHVLGLHMTGAPWFAGTSAAALLAGGLVLSPLFRRVAPAIPHAHEHA